MQGVTVCAALTILFSSGLCQATADHVALDLPVSQLMAPCSLWKINNSDFTSYRCQALLKSRIHTASIPLGSEGKVCRMTMTNVEVNFAIIDSYLNLALASAANLCCIEIVSRTAQQRESWSVIMKVYC